MALNNVEVAGMSGIFVFVATKVYERIERYLHKKNLKDNHVPELNAEAVFAHEQAACGWREAWESQNAKTNAIEQSNLNLEAKVAGLIKRMERMELDKVTTDHVIAVQRTEIETLESMIGVFYTLISKADKATIEKITSLRDKLNLLRSEAHEWISKRRETIMFLTGDLPAMEEAGVALDNMPSGTDYTVS